MSQSEGANLGVASFFGGGVEAIEEAPNVPLGVVGVFVVKFADFGFQEAIKFRVGFQRAFEGQGDAFGFGDLVEVLFDPREGARKVLRDGAR